MLWATKYRKPRTNRGSTQENDASIQTASKAIKSRHIVQNDNSWQDMENQRQRSLQDIYDNSIAEYLEGYDDEIE